jgi:hypothetical protein
MVWDVCGSTGKNGSSRRESIKPQWTFRRSRDLRATRALAQSILEKLCAEPEDPDDAIPNGSSIALLAEYDGRKILLAADAHPSVLKDSLNYLTDNGRTKLELDLFKVAHHGSQRNTTTKLLSMIDCHDHPDNVALARIMKSTKRQKTLHFNCDQPRLSGWKDKKLMRKYRFELDFPEQNGRLDLEI